MKKNASHSLLIRNLHTLVTMDAAGTRIDGGFLYAEAGQIRQIGKTPPRNLRADVTVDGRTCVAVPGLINTHHHLFQTLTRACTDAANAELFQWLTTNYPKWAHIDEEATHV